MSVSAAATQQVANCAGRLRGRRPARAPTPARQAGGARREAVRALGWGGQGTALGPGPPGASPVVQLWPSNRLVTEPSLNTSLIARASSGAIDSTVSLSNCFSCGTGSVFVMMISLILEVF